MSKTKYVDLECTFRWAKVFPHNRDMVGYKNPKRPSQPGVFEAFDGAYTVDCGLDAENLEKFLSYDTAKGDHVRDKPKVEDGLTWVRFVRKHEDGDKYWASGPPKVYGVPEGTQTIGNDSKGKVRIAVYETSMATGTRLEGIIVDDLVEYVREDDNEIPF